MLLLREMFHVVFWKMKQLTCVPQGRFHFFLDTVQFLLAPLPCAPAVGWLSTMQSFAHTTLPSGMEERIGSKNTGLMS